MSFPELQDNEFALFQRMIYDTAGINMSPAKKALVGGRLAKRIKHYGLSSYQDYFSLLNDSQAEERQVAVDLLTTNETYFFREPRHFDFLRDRILPDWLSGSRRVWSAASSSGEEAYTLAMLLADHAPIKDWDILGTDISTRVLERARAGHYPIERANNIPQQYLKRHCLKGTGSQAGTFMISRALRDRVRFVHGNLKQGFEQIGSFDVIFLRNVLIYFDLETKRQVVEGLLRRLKPGGYLFVGHSESLNGVTSELSMIIPSVYRKP